MSSYDKVVKGATKPKAGGIKPKYIDPIIATTFATDGSLQDVCRSLGNRLRDSNVHVVFKSLVILHTMIRNGEVDNVLGHLASDSGNIRLRNLASSSWSGANAPQTLSVYAQYLDERVRAYRDLKHDVIRSSDRSRAHANGASNSNRLRRLTVEKGLLREVSTTQKVASVLMQCSFFLDDLNDDLVMSAFRMTLKDLLAIYTAINEGVINILEHYFEMAKSDAERALELYRRFCRQTENVVAFLNSAKKASHSLNLAVPSLKHAPVSLAGALEEYLNDPNFEQNRKEYRENKRIADGAPAPSKPSTVASSTNAGVPKSESKKSITIQEPEKPERKLKPPTSNQDLQDFFASIESDNGQNMFSNVPTEQSFFALQAQPTGMMGMNGFGGMGMGMGMGGGGLQPQMTGYNPFMAQQQTGMMGMQPTGFVGMNGMQPQMTGFLQPQATGFNPFRQSVMPQPTGFGGPFGSFDGQASAFGQQQLQQQQPQQQPQQSQQQQSQQIQPLQQQNTATPSNPQLNGTFNNSFQPSLPNQQPQQQQQSSALSAFNSAFGDSSSNAQSTPGGSGGSAATPKPLMPQKTGSRNPFAPPPGSTPPPASPPPSSKGPSLNQLAMNAFAAPNGGNYGLGANTWDGTDPSRAGQQQQQQQQQQTSGLMPQKTGLIGNIASEFAFANRTGTANTTSNPTSPGLSTLNASSTGASGFPGMNGSSASATSSDLTSQFSSMSFGSSAQTGLQPQPTGFAGSNVKPFKPESSFGSQLALQPQFTGMPSASTPGAALSPQMTGNPFARVSSPSISQPGTAGQNQNTVTGSVAFAPFNSAFSSTSAQPQAQMTSPHQSGSQFQQQPQQQQPQQQQSQTTSTFSAFTPASQPFAAQIQPQPTGFSSNVKPFQPSSDFGKSISSNPTAAANTANQNDSFNLLQF
ncbi:ANTH-domain-containing protein [Testicularia cyperi]|uniref:ANTH-domain-containing protein n=1 Tax=Testicularia cyperi TaxID=1882483 RepID=A0A317XUY6_9BASI|nr:ANTH-domain-containing protein [Testicularia cyperi]